MDLIWTGVRLPPPPPVATKLVEKLIKDNNVTILYEGIESSGDYSNVMKLIEMIKREKEESDKIN